MHVFTVDNWRSRDLTTLMTEESLLEFCKSLLFWKGGKLNVKSSFLSHSFHSPSCGWTMSVFLKFHEFILLKPQRKNNFHMTTRRERQNSFNIPAKKYKPFGSVLYRFYMSSILYNTVNYYSSIMIDFKNVKMECKCSVLIQWNLNFFKKRKQILRCSCSLVEKWKNNNHKIKTF